MYPAGSLGANLRLQYKMSHRSNAGPVRRLKLVTLLFALSPGLLFLGAGLKLQDNGYDGLLLAINPRVPENLNLIANIKVSESAPLLTHQSRNAVRFERERYREQHF